MSYININIYSCLIFVEVFLEDAVSNLLAIKMKRTIKDFFILSRTYISVVGPIYCRYRWSCKSPESPDNDSRSCALKSPMFNLLMDTGTSTPLELSETEWRRSVCFSPSAPPPQSCDWCESQPRMVFPGLGRGQGWSAATFPLSSWATAPSLYLRSPNNIHAALVPLGRGPTPHTTQGGGGGLSAR